MGSIELNPQEKLNELRLYVNDSSQIRRTLIFVEGISDIRFYRKLFNSNNTRVELMPGGGGRPPIEALVNKWRTDKSLHDRIIAILDADFTRILNPDYEEDPVFLTDNHDMEMMVLSNTDVFDALVSYYVLEGNSNDIRSSVEALLYDISLVKMINQELDYHMKFDGFGFMHLLNVNTDSVNLDQFLRVVIAKGGENCITTVAEIKEIILARNTEDYNKQELINGHDFVRTLTHIFREKYGYNRLQDIAIESAIQIAYTKEHFKSTQLYQKLQAWQESHAVEILIA